ncbi:MAG: bifunctional DNA-formamidopyrimidine glycosylase/DNA-(apurinic or apyrimidinic site) lyase [Actinomycetota bacterium]
MPELPEVETIRGQLEERLVGRVIGRVAVDDALLVAPAAVTAFARGLRGRTVTAVRRRGKYLLVDLDAGPPLALHLRMTGRLLWFPGRPDPDVTHVRARFDLGGGGTLVFADMRRFGRAWRLPEGLPDEEAYWAGRVGVEPLGDGFTAAALGGLLAGRRGPVKPLLLNQAVVAGIGNIYADEALFQARVHPLRPAGSLDRDEVRRLHRAIRDRLRAAVAAGGSSIDRYRDANGDRGGMQDLLRVHRREGRPCVRCGATVVKTRVGGRGTYLCPGCQAPPA